MDTGCGRFGHSLAGCRRFESGAGILKREAEKACSQPACNNDHEGLYSPVEGKECTPTDCENVSKRTPADCDVAPVTARQNDKENKLELDMEKRLNHEANEIIKEAAMSLLDEIAEVVMNEKPTSENLENGCVVEQVAAEKQPIAPIEKGEMEAEQGVVEVNSVMVSLKLVIRLTMVAGC